MSNINLEFVERSQPSLFIHFAYQNVTEEMVRRTLDALDLGTIKEISFKPSINKKEENGNSIAIHFDRWFRNMQADKVREKIITGKSIDINYTAKSYWKVVAFQQKSKPEVQSRGFKKPTITFDDEDDEYEYQNKFGPKLGVDCSEKYNSSKIRCDEKPSYSSRPRQQRDENPRPRDEKPRQRDERPRQRDERPRQRDERPRDERPRDERPRPKNDRPIRRTDDMFITPPTYKIPVTPPGLPPKQCEQFNLCVLPDAFDMNQEIACQGVMLPPPKKQKTIAKLDTPKLTTHTTTPIATNIIKRSKINFLDDSDDSSDDDDEKYSNKNDDAVDEISDMLYSDL